MTKPIYPQQHALLKKKKTTKKKSKKQKNNFSQIQIGKNLQKVKTQIYNAAIKSGRSPNNITIVAVTKSFPLEIWDFALAQNLSTIGESRIQEAQQKNKKFDRKQLQIFFERKNNQTRTIITGNILKQPIMKNKKFKYHKKTSKISNDVIANGMLLGCHQGIKIRKLDYICYIFKKFIKLKKL